MRTSCAREGHDSGIAMDGPPQLSQQLAPPHQQQRRMHELCAACLFLAAKAEEAPRTIRDVMNMVHAERFRMEQGREKRGSGGNGGTMPLAAAIPAAAGMIANQSFRVWAKNPAAGFSAPSAPQGSLPDSFFAQLGGQRLGRISFFRGRRMARATAGFFSRCAGIEFPLRQARLRLSLAATHLCFF